MVQIIPPKTNLGTQFGEALGGGLAKGISQGSDIGFQRGLLQQGLQKLQNLPSGSTPVQLATALMEATAGIPGAERYVGQLFQPLLAAQQTQAAFGGQGGQGGMGGQNQQPPGQGEELPGGGRAASPSSQKALNVTAAGGKGLLSNVKSEEQMNMEAEDYARRTQSGIPGYNLRKEQLKDANANIAQQRRDLEAKFETGGIPKDEIPFAMQIANQVQGTNADDIYRNSKPLIQKYRNLTKSLDNFSYPWVLSPEARNYKLSRLQNTAKDLTALGFEDKVRETLTTKGLSPTEISEIIHPPSKEVRKALDEIPNSQFPFNKVGKSLFKSNYEKDDKIKDFLREHTDPNLSLLQVRHDLWNKGYDWERIAGLMNDVYRSENPPQLTPEQLDDLSTLEKEPPRQSLAYIFQDIGNIKQFIRNQK